MLKKGLVPALTMALLAGASAVSFASDWVEEGMPPVAPSRQTGQPAAQQQQGNYLTGSATRFSKQLPAEQPMSPRYAQQQATLGADASQFIASVRKDTVVPPGMMRQWIDRAHPEFRLNAQQNSADAVIEVKGAWDKASQILNAMGVPHRQIKAKELRELSLANAKVLVINCEGKIPDDCAEKVRQWVVRGGYLISTDWTLHSFLERAFPGMVAWNGGNTDGAVVDAMIVERDPALFQGVPVQRAAWKLDEESQMIKVLRPDVVRVLARSYRLGMTDPNRRDARSANELGVLACEFPYGRGRVLHLVGHYDYNSPLTFSRNVLQDAIPGVGVGLRQAISTNFLLQGLSKPARTAQAN